MSGWWPYPSHQGSHMPEGRGQTTKFCRGWREGLIGLSLGTVCERSLKCELQPQPLLCPSPDHTDHLRPWGLVLRHHCPLSGIWISRTGSHSAVLFKALPAKEKSQWPHNTLTLSPSNLQNSVGLSSGATLKTCLSWEPEWATKWAEEEGNIRAPNLLG